MITCMQHQQLQKHEGLVLQMVLPCIVASYEHHIYEEVFEMDLWQLEYFQYKSAMIKERYKLFQSPWLQK